LQGLLALWSDQYGLQLEYRDEHEVPVLQILEIVVSETNHLKEMKEKGKMLFKKDSEWSLLNKPH
jgi:hypothetical protein